MKNIKVSLKNSKKYIKIIFLLLCLGFFIGFILTKKINLEETITQIKDIESYLNNNINFIYNHLTSIGILFLGTLTIIGVILFPINIIYEGICIFLNIYIFLKAYKINGLIYGIIYNLLTKSIYIIILFLIFKKILFVFKTLISKKEKIEKKEIIIKKSKQIIIYICLIFLNDVLIFLFANKILSLFLFIIK